MGSSAFDQHIFEFSPNSLEKVAVHCGLTMKDSIAFALESRRTSFLKRIIRARYGWGKLDIFLAYFT